MREVKYKSKLYNTRIIEADRWFPSSKTCHICGFVHAGLNLSDRVWNCPNCGAVHDRDVNASINLKQLATVKTALPVASPTATEDADVSLSSETVYSAGKVTPANVPEYRVCDSVRKKDRVRKRKAAEMDVSSLPSTF